MPKQTFVITGGNQGLGKAVALLAYRHGYPVALIGRNPESLHKAKEEIQNHSASLTQSLSIHSVDLTNEEATQHVFEEILHIHEGIQVLVNNAATWTGGKGIAELTTAEVRRSLDLNFFSAVHASQAALRVWEQTGNQALCMINIGATASLRGAKHSAAFAIAKAALRIFSQSLAKEYAPLGIHVAHFVIDGMINNLRTRNLNPQLPEERFMAQESLAQSILQVAEQEPSCWTFEWDARPYTAVW